jgi:hypothetical protein
MPEKPSAFYAEERQAVNSNNNTGRLISEDSSLLFNCCENESLPIMRVYKMQNITALNRFKISVNTDPKKPAYW